MLLALFQTAAGERVVGVDAQHGAPSGCSLLMVAKRVVNRSKVKPGVKMVATASDGRFEI